MDVKLGLYSTIRPKTQVTDCRRATLPEATQQQALLEQSGQYQIAQVRDAFQDCMTDHCVSSH